MNVAFGSRFERDLRGIRNPQVLATIRSLIVEIEQAASVASILNLKKLHGFEHYFRVRTGDYRVGIRIENNTVTFLRCLHRRDIYRFFP